MQNTDEHKDLVTQPQDTQLPSSSENADPDGVIPEDDSSSEEDTVIEDTSTPEEDKALRAKSIQTFGKFSTIGLHLLFAVIIGYVIGRWLDKTFDIYPVMTLFWVVCGILSTIFEFIKLVKDAQRLDDDTSHQS